MMRLNFCPTLRLLRSVLATAFLASPVAVASSLDNIAQEASRYFTANAGASTVTGHDPWLNQALDLQNKVDYAVPLATATFLMTHNSYNAAAYRTAFSYLDPNQRLSLGQQLQAGIRSLELDVHRFFSMTGWPWQWRQRLLLCHGQSNHLGCSPYDRPLEAGIDEIKRWLDDPKNAGEVIVIYIEDHIDGRYGELVGILSQRIGNKVYRPTATGCQGIPMHITKQHVLDSGKQVLLMGAADVCTSNSGWNSWAFAGVGDRLNGYPTGQLANVDGVRCDFDRAFYDQYWVRFYEDRTLLSNVVGSPNRIEPVTATQLQKCGANLVGFDKLAESDARLHASVWSWDVGQPSDIGGHENCAQQTENARLHDRACTEVARYACFKPKTHQWWITRNAGTWDQGRYLCQLETGGEYVFAAPTNGFDNEQLRSAKLAQGVPTVWVDLNDQPSEGRWQGTRP